MSIFEPDTFRLTPQAEPWGRAIMALASLSIGILSHSWAGGLASGAGYVWFVSVLLNAWGASRGFQRQPKESAK